MPIRTDTYGDRIADLAFESARLRELEYQQTQPAELNIYTITIAVSILIYIAVGNYAGRGVKRLDDYYVAGRRAPTLIIAGTLAADGSLDWFAGEALFAMSWLVVYVSSGLWAARVLRKDYLPAT